MAITKLLLKLMKMDMIKTKVDVIYKDILKIIKNIPVKGEWIWIK